MNKKLISIIISGVLLQPVGSVYAQDAWSEYKSASETTKTVNESGSFIGIDFYNKFNSLTSEEDQYDFLVQVIKQNKTDMVKIDLDSGSTLMPMNAFMLLRGYNNIAFQLVEDGYSDAFELFDFNNSQSSDLGIAIEQGNFTYLESVLSYVDDVNKRFKYNNEVGFTLLMLSSFVNRVETYNNVKLLLGAGADINLMSYNNYNALSIAQNNENKFFLDAVSDYNTELERGRDDFQSNNLVSLLKREEIKRINQNLSAGMMEDIFDKNDHYNALYTMILNGYSEPANRIIDEMIKRDLFDPNYVDSDGVSLLMMVALSDIRGGDVELAKKIIDLGADVNYKNSDGFSAAEAAVMKDAYKVFYQFMLAGFNPFTEKTSEGYDYMELAIKNDPIAINIATMIRESVLILSEVKEK